VVWVGVTMGWSLGDERSEGCPQRLETRDTPVAVGLDHVQTLSLRQLEM
jgi:hypothetical protein